jgi:hypothetical protein
MEQFEQDGLELGRRVACSLHYQHPGNLRLLQAAKTEPRLATASTTMATPSSLESGSLAGRLHSGEAGLAPMPFG